MSQDQYLIYATSQSGGAGYFETTDSTNQLAALHASATNGTGIEGHSKGGIGISGTTDTVDSLGGITAVFGQCITSRSGYAGVFVGQVNITGKLTQSSSQSKIDHPLEPANKYLSHSIVESSEMKNIYDGIAILDARGEAIVELPDWFEALNKDFRYQLTCIGGYAPVYIAEKLQNKRFKVAGGHAGLEVCWQVTGIRHDTYASTYPLVVEEEKQAAERGYYRHPEVYDQPEEKGIAWSRHPGHMG